MLPACGATADKDMCYQKNFAVLQISAVVIPSNRKRLVQESVPAFLQSREQVKPGQKVVMDWGRTQIPGNHYVCTPSNSTTST